MFAWCRKFGLTLVALAALAASPSLRADPLTVFAAASLKDALDDVALAWKAKGGGPVVTSYASSSTLAKQIEQGAPADIFISADTQWMDYLAAKSLVTDMRILLGNQLVLIANTTDQSIAVALRPGVDLAGKLGSGRLALGDPSNVPAGLYAREALQNLGAWDAVQSKLAPAPDVRAALKLVSRGETPLGIVYQTDAQADPTVRIVSYFPEDSHSPIRYPAAQVKASHNPDDAKFLDFLKSRAAAAIFTRYGFTLAGGQ
jgi:molybdate transport system substrate-binding protein